MMSLSGWTVLWQLEKGLIVGNEHGSVRWVDPRVETVEESPSDGQLNIARTAMQLVQVLDADGNIAELVPIELKSLGDYVAWAGYSHTRRTWFLKGEPKKVAVTDGAWMMGLDTPEGRKQAE